MLLTSTSENPKSRTERYWKRKKVKIRLLLEWWDKKVKIFFSKNRQNSEIEIWIMGRNFFFNRILLRRKLQQKHKFLFCEVYECNIPVSSGSWSTASCLLLTRGHADPILHEGGSGETRRNKTQRASSYYNHETFNNRWNLWASGSDSWWFCKIKAPACFLSRPLVDANANSAAEDGLKELLKAVWRFGRLFGYFIKQTHHFISNYGAPVFNPSSESMKLKLTLFEFAHSEKSAENIVLLFRRFDVFFLPVIST